MATWLLGYYESETGKSRCITPETEISRGEKLRPGDRATGMDARVPSDAEAKDRRLVGAGAPQCGPLLATFLRHSRVDSRSGFACPGYQLFHFQPKRRFP